MKDEISVIKQLRLSRMILRCVLRISCVVLFLGTAFSAKLASAQIVQLAKLSGIDVKFSTFYEKVPLVGFFPVQIQIKNYSGKKRTWSFQAVCSSSYANETQSELKKSLTVEDGQERSFELLVPLAPYFISQSQSPGYVQLRLQAELSGYGIVKAELNASSDVPNWARDQLNLPYILMSESLSLRSWDVLKKELKHRKISLSGSSFDPTHLPGQWRAYLGVHLLILTDREWDNLSPSSKNAISDWLSMGGRLYLFHQGSFKNAARDYGSFQVGRIEKEGKVLDLGLGEIHFYRWNGREIEPEFDARLAAVSSKHALVSSLSNGYRSWNLARQVPSLKFSLPFLWALAAMILLYAAIIGPVNVFIFAGRNERLLLFLTTPLIAAAASVVFLLLVIFREGFGAWGHMTTGVYLLPESKKAVVVQEQVVRTSLLLTSDFETRGDLFVSPVPVSSSPVRDLRWYAHNESSYSGDWFSNRRVLGHVLLDQRSTRARVELGRVAETKSLGTNEIISDIDPQMSLVSNINAPLRELYVFGENGRCWSAEGVPVGKKIELKALPIHHCRTWVRGELAPSAGALLGRALEKTLGQENTFFAIADKDPGFEIETLSGIRWQRRKVIIFGHLPVSRMEEE